LLLFILGDPHGSYSKLFKKFGGRDSQALKNHPPFFPDFTVKTMFLKPSSRFRFHPAAFFGYCRSPHSIRAGHCPADSAGVGERGAGRRGRRELGEEQVFTMVMMLG